MVTLENSAAKMKVSGRILLQILQHPAKKVRTCLNIEKKKNHLVEIPTLKWCPAEGEWKEGGEQRVARRIKKF